MKYSRGRYQLAGVVVCDDQMVAEWVKLVGIDSGNCGTQIRTILFRKYVISQSLRGFDQIRLPGDYGFKPAGRAG